VIEADFDRIALLDGNDFDNSAPYQDLLLDLLLRAHGTRAGNALDIGCGKGHFTRLLSVRADRVLGLDLSANMIAAARRLSQGFSNIEFERADVLSWDWPRDRFDVIVSIATLHHLPMEDMLRRMRDALRPGGTLAVLDIFRVDPWQHVFAVFALPLSVWRLYIRTGRWRQPAEARRLWAEHGRTDRYLTVREVRRICASVLPGARVRRHLLWRYSMVWSKSC